MRKNRLYWNRKIGELQTQREKADAKERSSSLASAFSLRQSNESEKWPDVRIEQIRVRGNPAEP